jgi:hypothetical protein
MAWKAIIKQPDGHVRTKLFDSETAAKIWIDTKGRFIPEGSQWEIKKVK